MTDAEREALVERIGSAILVNLCDRRGIRHALHDIDRDVMDEIRTTLGTIALSEAEPVVRKDEREACAKWHDEQAGGEDALAKAALGLDDDDYRHHRLIGREHRHAAAAIRASPQEDTR